MIEHRTRARPPIAPIAAYAIACHGCHCAGAYLAHAIASPIGNIESARFVHGEGFGEDQSCFCSLVPVTEKAASYGIDDSTTSFPNPAVKCVVEHRVSDGIEDGFLHTRELSGKQRLVVAVITLIRTCICVDNACRQVDRTNPRPTGVGDVKKTVANDQTSWAADGGTSRRSPITTT